MKSNIKTPTNEDEIDLRKLLDVIWSGKWVIFVLIISSSLIAVLYSISLPNVYKSEALLSPVVSEVGSSGAMSNIGGLASLAGINLQTQSVGNSTKADISYISSDITKNTKIALKYKQNDFALWVDGFKQGTDTNGITFPSGTLNSFDFNDNGTGGNPFYGKTKELAVFKEALTDAELESLTSWISFVEMATDLEYTLE